MDGQVPVEIPGILTPQMTIAIGPPLVGCQFIRSNRTAGMKFVRADAYYRSQAIIATPLTILLIARVKSSQNLVIKEKY